MSVVPVPVARQPWRMLIPLISLVLFGALVLYSAAGGDWSTYAVSHLVRFGVFLTMAVIMTQFRREFVRFMAYPAYGVILVMLVAVEAVGFVGGGSQRWLDLGFMQLQPSEFMKLFAAIYVADYTIRKSAVMDSFTRGFLPMVAVMVIVGWLLLREPDFGAFAVIAAISISILWLGGINGRIFAGLLALLPVAIVGLIWSSPYRLQRVIGFMDPWADPFGKGYQLSHALIAFGRGEWFGVGLGASVEKLLYLPEAHTDFLLAVIAEELGFVGVLTVIALVVVMLYLDPLLSLIVLGIYPIAALPVAKLSQYVLRPAGQ